MSKVNYKIKWQKDAPCVTLRASGRWDEVIQTLHSAAMAIKEQAEARYGGAGVPKSMGGGMRRERAETQVLPAPPPDDSVLE